MKKKEGSTSTKIGQEKNELYLKFSAANSHKVYGVICKFVERFDRHFSSMIIVSFTLNMVPFVIQGIYFFYRSARGKYSSPDRSDEY